MKAFPSNYNTEKNKKTGASPVWILKMPFATGTIYLSDRVFTVVGWEDSPATKNWVHSWGQIDEDIAGESMGVSRVSDFSMSVINDPNDNNIEAILWNPTNKPETTDCELYLWFLGLDASTDPPQRFWAGNIMDWQRRDELIYELQFVDMSVRLDKYIGSKIDKEVYPSASPDDIGKIGNIVYGTVKKVPAAAIVAGALDYLDAAISASQNTINLVDASEFPASGTIGIENEEITYTGKSGNNLTGCSRGANSTSPAVHKRGSVVWEQRNDFTYLAAAHAIRQFDNIYAEGHNTRLKITGICSLYSGQGGSQHGTYPNKAIIVVPQKITRQQAVDLLVQDGIAVNDAIAVLDTIGVNDGITVNDLLNIGDNISLADPQHGHSVTAERTSVRKRGIGIAYQNNISFADRCNDGNESTSAYTTNQTYSSQLESTFIPPLGTIHGAWIWIKGVGYFSKNGFTTGVYVYFTTQWTSLYVTESVTSAGLYMPAGNSLTLYEVEVEYDYTPAPAANNSLANITKAGSTYRSGSVAKAGTAAKTGSASKSGSVTKSGTVTITGNSVADSVVADKVVVDLQGYQDDASGTYTGTPNALIERPDHVIKHLLNVYAGVPVLDFQTNAGSMFAVNGYKFNGVINEYKRLKEWLGYLAFQCRCYFRFYAGKSMLMQIPASPSSNKMLTSNMIRMQEDYKTTTRVSRSRLDEVVNVINCHFDRDWTEPSKYKQIKKASDSGSIARYGEKERPEYFIFDFITDDSRANDLTNFYLARYKDRKKIIDMDVFLNNIELEMADTITFEPQGSILCEVQKANIQPGSGRDMRNDKISMRVREY